MLKRGETMQIFETILIFLAVVIASSLVHIDLPKIPLAFILLMLVMLLYITPIPVEFHSHSELFIVALISPLLIVEGVKVSRAHLRRYIKAVLMMALGLVVITVIVVGLFVHGIWPE